MVRVMIKPHSQIPQMSILWNRDAIRTREEIVQFFISVRNHFEPLAEL